MPENKQVMSFSELALVRQSDRKYTDKPISRENLEKCIEAGRIAPSASNSQPWTFVAVIDSELKNKVAHCTYGPLKTFNKFVPSAPVLVAIVMERSKTITELGGRIKNKEYSLLDIGIAAEHICLQAAEMGIGSCMLGWFDERKVKELLKVPEKKSIPLLITLGYTPEGYRVRKKTRKKLKDIIRYNGY